MSKRFQRFLSILCIATMLSGSMPANVFAESTSSVTIQAPTQANSVAKAKKATSAPTAIPLPTVPVDKDMKVNKTVKGKVEKNSTYNVRLTVKKNALLTLIATGMDLWLDLTNESDGSKVRYASQDGKLQVRWNAKAGTYLLTFGALKNGATGSFSVSVFDEKEATATPKPTKK
ncbi:MAG: hypothetical protein IJ662_12490, partial [Clostridia bacterium]|nr:hypothetical protein [Clostridia bacterium]